MAVVLHHLSARLGVEEQFYLVLPVVLVLTHRYAQRWLVPALVAALLLSLGRSAVLTPIRSVASYFLLPTRAWEMLAGRLIAAVVIPQPRRQIWRESLAILVLLAIVGPAFLYSEYTEFPGYAAVLPVAGTVVLIWLGTGHATHVGYLLQLRPVVYIGLISYSLYLWHWPLIVFARLQSGLQPSDQSLPMLLALSMGLAALSHRFIEARFRKSGAATQRPKLLPALHPGRLFCRWCRSPESPQMGSSSA